MSKILPLQPSSPKSTDAPPAEHIVEQTKALIQSLVASLPPAEEQEVARFINDKVGAAASFPGARAGGVLGKLIELLPRQKSWKAAELKQLVEKSGVAASPKEVYNALHYLARRGNLRRVGYGQYLFDGVLLTTLDDFGGERTRHEDLSDDIPQDRAGP